MCNVCAHSQGAMQNPYVNSAPIRTSAFDPKQCGIPGHGSNTWELAGYNFTDVQVCCLIWMHIETSYHGRCGWCTKDATRFGNTLGSTSTLTRAYMGVDHSGSLRTPWAARHCFYGFAFLSTSHND
ncbi:hypothetical protein HaLaN_02214 [Haematococcus lacustris]|uniref:Uncharacterized protein n=1 Tax=Haematococcus lacustris TaxID=44745 RepID=A0A699YMV7_HAELA|nr:hypothetical protein HaLaN_02214 [Haematococcus lacustris]